jgi:hypothetical protein
MLLATLQVILILRQLLLNRILIQPGFGGLAGQNSKLIFTEIIIIQGCLKKGSLFILHAGNIRKKLFEAIMTNKIFTQGMKNKERIDQ